MLGAVSFTGLLVILCGIIIPIRAEYPPPEMKEFLKNLHDICVKKLGLPDDISKNYDISNKSPEIMCYMKCLMIEGKWAGEDEVFKFDLEHVHPEVKPVLELILSKCQNIPRGTQECETTYNFFVCAHDADPEHFYMP